MGRLKDLEAIGDLVSGKSNSHIPESPYLAKKYFMLKTFRGTTADIERKRRGEGTNKKSRIMETFPVIKEIFLKKR